MLFSSWCSGHNSPRLPLLTPDFASVHVGASAIDDGSHDPDADKSALEGRDAGGKGRTSRYRSPPERQGNRQKCLRGAIA